MGCGSSQKTSRPSKVAKVQTQIVVNCALKGKIEDYDIQDLIGVGHRSEVYLALHKISQAPRTIKVYKLKELSAEDRQLLEEEATLISTLDHENIVRCFDYFSDEANFYLVTEICTGGELLDRVMLQKKSFSEAQAAKIIKEVLLALTYSHSLNIVHKDLKPSSILFMNDAEDSPIKVLDCSFSRLKKNIGSPRKKEYLAHLSPEALISQTEQKSDVWSCGVVLHIMMFGTPPDFQKDGSLTLKESKDHSHSLELLNFLGKLVKKQLDQRYSASEALEDPWIKKFERNELSFEVSTAVLETFKQNYSQQKIQEVIGEFIYRHLSLDREREQMNKLFASFDEDHNGNLDQLEFEKGMKTLYGNFFSSQRLSELFKECDNDGNGKINYQEFSTKFSGIQKNLNKDRIEKAFKMLDIDGNGMISLQEFKRQFVESGQLDENTWKGLIEKIDINGDLQISLEEFKMLFY